MGERDPLSPLTAAEIAAAPSLPSEGLTLDAPLRAVPKLLALAGNYRKHVAESGFSGPSKGIWTPQIFWKPTTSILAPGGSVPIRANNVFFDWEVELAVIIGKRVKDVTVADAMSCVFGYTIVN